MRNWFGSNALRPAAGSLVDRWWGGNARHPDEFGCGVRVLDGAVVGESTRWRFRRSAIDRFPHDGFRGGELTLNHGHTVLRLLLPVQFPASVAERPRRTGHMICQATEAATGAHLLISVHVGQLDRFGAQSL